MIKGSRHGLESRVVELEAENKKLSHRLIKAEAKVLELGNKLSNWESSKVIHDNLKNINTKLDRLIGR